MASIGDRLRQSRVTPGQSAGAGCKLGPAPKIAAGADPSVSPAEFNLAGDLIQTAAAAFNNVASLFDVDGA